MIFIAWIVFIPLEPKTSLWKQVCENKVVYNFVITPEDTKILEFNQYKKSDKVTFIIYEDLECFIEKIDGCIKIILKTTAKLG